MTIRLLQAARLFFAVALLFGIAASSVLANSYTWTGASGTAWSSSSDWSSVTPTSTDVAVFSSTSFSSYVNQPTVDMAGLSVLGILNSGTGAVTIGGANALTVNADGITIAANAGELTINAPITVGAAQSWTENSFNYLNVGGNVNNNGFLLTIKPVIAAVFVSGGISGTGGLTETAASDYSLFLSGANTFSGTTTYTGNLVLQNSLALQNSTVSAASGNNYVEFAGLTSATFGGLSGNATNTFINLFNTQGGGVALSIGNNNTNQLFAGSLTGLGSVTKIGTGTQIFSGNNVYTGATTISGGTLELNGSNSVQFTTVSPTSGALAFGSVTSANLGGLGGSGNITLTNTASANVNLIVGAYSPLSTYSGALSGGGGLIKTGTGTLVLTGNNSNSGSTTIAGGGTLQLNYAVNPSVLNATSAVNMAGATLSLVGSNSGSTSQTVGNIAIQPGQSTIVLNANGGAGTSLSAGLIAPASPYTPGDVLNVVTTAAGGGSVTTMTAPDGTGIYLGRVVYNGSDWATSIQGSSPYTLSAYSGYATFTGSSDTSNFNYQLATSAAVAPGGETINTLKIASPSAGQALDLAGNQLVVNGSGLLVTGTGGYSIVDSIGTGSLTGGNAYGLGFSELIINQYNSGGLTISAQISNNFPTSLTIAGTGATTLAGANNYSGTSTLAGGTAILANSAALSSGSITFAGGSLQYTSSNTVDYSSKIVNSSGPIAINLGGQNVTFGTSLAASNTGGLAISGPGMLSLSSGVVINSTGGISIAGGTLAVASAALGSSTVSNIVNLGSGGVLNLNAASSFTIYNAINGSGTINSNPATGSTVTFAGLGNGSFNGTLNCTGTGANTVTEIFNTSLSGGTINIANGSTMFAAGSYIDSVINISGTGTSNGLGALRMDNNNGSPVILAGTVVLGSSNTYLGNGQQYPSIISGNIVGSAAIGSTGTLTYWGNGNGALYLSGSNSFGALTLDTFGGVVMGSSSSLTPGVVISFAGSNTGNANNAPLHFTNYESLCLNGYNLTIGGLGNPGAGSSQYSWLASIGNQSVQIGQNGLRNNVPATLNIDITSGSLNTFSGLIANTGGTNGVIGSTLAASAPLSVTMSAGTLVLTGTTTYTGLTSLNGGMLSLSNSQALYGTASTSGSGITFGGGVLQYSASNKVDYSPYILNSTGPIALNTNGQTVTFASPLAASNVGGLTLTGSGGLVLNAANSYSGLTTVSSGTLTVNGSLLSSGSMNVAGGAAISGTGSVGLATVMPGGLINLSANGAHTLSFANLNMSVGTVNLSALSSYNSVPAITAGGLSISGLVDIALNSADISPAPGTYEIFGYSGSLGGGGLGSFAVSAPALAGSLSASISSVGGAIDLLISSTSALTWSGSNGSGWTTANNWTLIGGGAATYSDSTQLTFNDSAGANTSVTLNVNNVSPASVTFSNSSAAYTLSGTYGISGATSLQKIGNGSLTISNSNGYTGGTMLSAGQLNINNPLAIGTGTLTISGGSIDNTSGGTIALATNNPQTWNGNVYFLGSNSFNMGTGGVAMTSSQTVTVANNTLTVGGVISGTGSLTKNGAGTLILTASNAYAGSTTISNGTLQVGNGGSTGSLGLGSIIDNGVLAVNRNDSGLVLSGAISGSGKVLFQGPGLTTITASNTYNGATKVSSGSLVVNGSLLSSGSLSVGSGAVLSGTGSVGLTTLASGGSINVSGNIAQTFTMAGLSFSGQNGVSLAALSNYSSVPAITASSLATAGGAGSINISMLSTDTTPALGTYELLSYNGSIGGDGFTDFKLTASAISGGLSAALVNNPGQVDLTISANSALTWTGTNGTSWSAANNWSQNGSASSFSNGASVLFNDTAGSSHALVTLDSSDVLSPLVFFNNSSVNYTVSGAFAIAGTSSLEKSGFATLTLDNSNSYTGGTVLTAGVLAINNPSAIGAGPLAISGGTIDNTSGAPIALANNNPIAWNGNFGFFGTNNLDLGSGSVSLNANTTVNVTAGTLSVEGVISGGGNLGLSGAGTLVLNSPNAYTGNTTVSGGVLIANAISALGSGSLSVTGGTLDANYAQSPSSVGVSGGVVNASVYGALGYGPLVQSGGTVNASAAQTVSSVTLSGGLLNLQDPNALGSGLFTISGGTIDNTSGSPLSLYSANPQVWNGNFAFLGSSNLDLGYGAVSLASSTAINVVGGTLTVDGVISGSGSLKKIGAGTLTLTASNSYTGGTTLNSGVLNIASGALGSGKITFTGSSTLQFGLFNTQDVSGQINLANGAAATIDTNGNTVNFASSFGGGSVSASLTKQGAGMLTINAANSYTGGTTVSGGTLVMGVYNAFGSAPVVVGSGAVLNIDVNGSIANIASAFAGNGTINVFPASGATTSFGTNFTNGTTFGGVVNLYANSGNGNEAVEIDGATGGTINVNNGATLSMFSGTITSAITVTGMGNTENFGALRIEQGSVLAGNITLLGNTFFGNQNGASVGYITGNIGQSGGSYGIQFGPTNGGMTYVLSGTGSYTGTTTIRSGTLILDNADAMEGSSVSPSGNLKLASGIGTFYFGGLTGNGNFSLSDSSGAPVSLVVGGNNQNTIYSGVLSGAGSLTLASTGTLTLSASNTFTGPTTVSSGTLLLNNSYALQASTVTPGNNGLAFGGGVGTVYLGGLSDPSGTGSLTLDDLFDESVVLAVGGNNQNTTYNGAISGDGGLTLHGTGTLTLGGSNSYLGGTTVSSGVLLLNGAAALGAGGSLTIGGNPDGPFAIASPASAPAVEAASPSLAPVPEPSTIVLLCAAALVVAGSMRRARRW